MVQLVACADSSQSSSPLLGGRPAEHGICAGFRSLNCTPEAQALANMGLLNFDKINNGPSIKKSLVIDKQV